MQACKLDPHRDEEIEQHDADKDGHDSKPDPRKHPERAVDHKVCIERREEEHVQTAQERILKAAKGSCQIAVVVLQATIE